MKTAVALALSLLLLGATASAQTRRALMHWPQASTGAQSDKRAGVISGRLADMAGQPIANAVVYVGSAASLRRESHNTSTDEQGRFRVADLPRGLYYVSPNVPGYVRPDEETRPRLYRAGDTVNLTMAKGGVITGTVLNHANEPMTGCTVQAMFIRDKENRPVSISRTQVLTEVDDRGVYRLYGLSSGTYVVVTAGKHPYVNLSSVYQNDVPTYYPSSTRDTAQSVTVQAGEEVSGIDIRYRGERGYAISGKVLGLAAESANVNFYVQLFNLTTRTVEGAANVGAFYPSNGDNGFAFYGVTDGEYIVTALLNRFDGKLGSGSGRARVKVKGADVTGIDITVVPHGSIAGTLVIEPLRNADAQSKCEIKRRLAPDEMLVKARREVKAGEPDLNVNSLQQSAPSDKGDFSLTWLEAGQYHIEPAMLGEDYFVQSITLPAPAKNQPPVDVTRYPLAVKSGDHLNNLTVTIAEGAAAARGRVVSATKDARLPDRLRIHLVPAEKEAANDVLRFAEAKVSADGAFVINNLAPGHYFILARPSADDETGDEQAWPVAWHATERAALLKQAAAANLTLDLQPCQRLSDYMLKYTPLAPKPARKKETR
ncbi:MAG: hypothetical protein V7641_1123 [Blastocatellia bacterium]